MQVAVAVPYMKGVGQALLVVQVVQVVVQQVQQLIIALLQMQQQIQAVAEVQQEAMTHHQALQVLTVVQELS
jgi:ABC-type multidrug transport system fused ATPase/permease subunit